MDDSTKIYDVLVIENDEIDRLLVRTLLNAHAPGRFRVTDAPDLRDGLQSLRADSFDLILLDHTIPDLSSIQEIRLVRAEENRTPIILHTGYIAPQMEKEALELGVREVVAKGQLAPLWSAIERVIEHRGEPVAVPSSVGQGRTVLVVEDEPAVRRIIRLSLELADYSVVEASNGEEALEVMHRQGPQIDGVVADLVMPRAGGDRLARALDRMRPELPVLFVSGASDDDLRRILGRVPHEDEVLWKPFTPEQLAGRVTKLLTASLRS